MKNNILILLVTLMIVTSFTFVNCQSADAKSTSKPANSHKNISAANVNAAPDFTLKGIDGNEVKLADYKGKVVMINFWATWCPPCRRELPDIVRIREELKDKGFEVIGVISEQPNSNILNTVNKMKESYGINYPLAWFNNKVINDYGPINGIPRTFILDKKGQIAVDLEGARPYSVFKQSIMKLLAE